MREFALLELPRSTLANGFSLVLARELALESLKDDEDSPDLMICTSGKQVMSASAVFIHVRTGARNALTVHTISFRGG